MCFKKNHKTRRLVTQPVCVKRAFSGAPFARALADCTTCCLQSFRFCGAHALSTSVVIPVRLELAIDAVAFSLGASTLDWLRPCAPRPPVRPFARGSANPFARQLLRLFLYPSSYLSTSVVSFSFAVFALLFVRHLILI